MPVSTDLNDYRFRTSLRVRLSETDAVGVVFFGSFSQYMDLGRMDYLDALGLDGVAGRATAMPPGVVVRSSVDFKSPARYRDSLDVNVRISEFGTSSYTWEFLFRDQRSPRVVALGSMVQVWVNADLKPEPLPKEFREQVGAFEGRSLSSN